MQAGMPSGAQGPLGLLRASQMVQQLLPGGIVQPMPQVEEEKKPQFIVELQINDFPQHARWKVLSSPATCSPFPWITCCCCQSRSLCKLMHGSSLI